MRIVIGQINNKIGDFRGNSSQIINLSLEAKGNGADIIVFPEMAVSGYPPMDLVHYDSFVNGNLKALEEIIQKIPRDIAVVVGYVDFNKSHLGKPLINRVSVLLNGEIHFTQDKTLLPTYDVFDEARYFEPAKKRSFFEYKGNKIAIAICEDIWWGRGDFNKDEYPKNPLDDFINKEIDLLLVPSASPFYTGKIETRIEIVTEIISKLNCSVLYVNMVGANDNLIFDGHSFYMNKSLGIELCQGFTKENRYLDTSTKIDNKEILTNKYENIEKALTLGVKDYIAKCGFSKVVIGSSGGIDSALVAYLATKALGKENVYTFSMPSRYSSEGSKTDARELADNLGVYYSEISIEPMFKEFIVSLDPFFAGTEPNVAEENIQARIRGTILMAYSNKFGGMVLTTGNKSELSTGYCTLYGDMAGGLSVIGDLFKTEVFELCEYINRNQEIIPVNILTKPPSAELRPDQKDEDTLPPYHILDGILNEYIVNNKSANEIIELGFNKETVEFVLKLTARSEYKRNQTPPVLKISKKAFGNGRRIPLARSLTEV